MSFSMSQITKKGKSKKEKINELFRVLNSNTLINCNIRNALKAYINYILRNRNNFLISEKTFSNMTDELFIKVCKKDLKDITMKDIKINENEIIYQIKRAIYYGATKTLYYDYDGFVSLDLVIEPPKSKSGNRTLSEEEVIDYFKDVMI